MASRRQIKDINKTQLGEFKCLLQVYLVQKYSTGKNTVLVPLYLSMNFNCSVTVSNILPKYLKN